MQQLIGHKAAKAHLAAKQASRSGTQSTNIAKPSKPTKKEESEDEDEGRTSMFKSKRQKKTPAPPATDPDVLDRGMSSKDDNQEVNEPPTKNPNQGPEDDDSEPKAPIRKPLPGKKKPVSYLDQILAERSKKKRK